QPGTPKQQLAYSALRLFTGFLVAAPIVFSPTTASVSNNINMPTIPNNQILILTFTSYLSSQLLIIHQVIGTAITNAINTSFKNSIDISINTCCTDAPRTLRMLISRIRFSMVNEARPAKPRQEIKMARHANTLVILLINCSVKNFFANSWSTNWYSNG